MPRNFPSRASLSRASGPRPASPAPNRVGLPILAWVGLLALASVGLLAPQPAARAAPPVERVRGTIAAVEGETVAVATTDGRRETLVLTPQTRFAVLVRSSLGAIGPGTYVGTATRGEDPPTALEVHIFPESMRGTGEGRRPWDAIPDPAAGGGPVETAMTNGTVTAGPGETAMTNGTVARGPGDGETLVLAFGDRSLAIRVPPGAPVVAYEPTDRSVVRAGAKVIATVERAGGTLTALRVAVGKDGLTPPQ